MSQGSRSIGALGGCIVAGSSGETAGLFFFGEAIMNESTCPRCEGTGTYQSGPWNEAKPCAVCNGTGKIKAEEEEEDNYD